MTQFLISPAERPPITTLGTVSSLPESIGADIVWQGLNGLAGAQRKATLDLIASVRDGRLGKELQQMSSLAYRFLIIEGSAAWTQDGKLNNPHVQWSLRQQWGVELSIQNAGVRILRSRTALETCATCEYLAEYTSKPHETSSLLQRNNAGMKNGWGRITDKNYCVHLLSGFEGIGKVLATRMWEKHGSAPIGLKMSREELLEIEGVGPKKVASVLKAFGITDTPTGTGA